MRHRLLALLPLGALALTGCGTPGPPEVTFFADGHAINAEPLIHCDVTVQKCEQSKDGAPKLKVRPGKPVQISVPSDVTETPWLVNVQYANAKGELQPVKQEVFTSGKQYAYTATTPAPDDQLLVVEIQQVGVATSVDATGKPNADAEGNPQLVARAVWSLQVQPG
ncbi:DUF2771 family protein [Amycolatopsis sp. CA-230715]|uniref:DUF2771 family protein n=1 Tax=Amycolatopsis sp. CA-230715 TaxID=2745196 RepID=UPI001C01BB79|nr:DUF2771 family protein [Amycolatopsis sp. CA-230715]QWF81684.1 hypothetical protein HUW46_05117 [Amycolatopsis sp. CA-230715]